MSHYTTLTLSFSNTETLVDALVACGVPRHAIEVHDTPQPIYDYQGHKTHYRINDHPDDKRFVNGDVANVIIRKSWLGAGHNDAGFLVDKEKGSVVFLCDFARGSTKFNDDWLGQIAQRYAVAEVKAEYEEQGQSVIEQEHEGEIFIYVKAGN